MSAEVAVRSAVIDALRADAMLMAGLNGLFDGVPVRAAVPYGVVGDCIATEWGAKDVEGRELTLTISLHDAGEAPGRLAPMLGRIGPVMAEVEMSGGWRIVSTRLLRARLSRTGARDGWQAVVDCRLRVVRI